MLRRRILPSIIALATLVMLTRPAAAQEIKPYVLLLFDTSGSMAWDVCGDGVGGDGSVECTGSALDCADCNAYGCTNSIADDSRLWKVKNGMSSVVSAYGEVTFGLARFRQSRRNFACTGGGWNGADSGYYAYCRIKCTTNSECGATGVCQSGACYICTNSSGNPTATCQTCNQNSQCPGPPSCVQNACRQLADPAVGSGDNQADILVPFSSDNANNILSWMNNRSDYPNPGDSGAPGNSASCSIPSCPDCGTGCDWELRAEGNTPLAGSLYDVRVNYFNGASGVIANDLKAGCRPYKVILLTDGQDNCLGDPVAEAGNLFNNAGKSIPVHVVGFASTALKPYLDSIAAAGGTTSAVIVDNEVSLALAIANIISESVLRETCNRADDNCNGSCDENWPEVGAPAGCSNAGPAQTCTAGVGICQRTGTYVCKADGSGSVCNATAGSPNPGGEICNNNLDDNCNGAVDEGCTPCIPQAEICNGKDDNCNGQIDEGYVSIPCGSSVGECKQGMTACIAGKVVCQGATPPVAELCDNKDNNCDTVVDGFTTACYASATGTPYTSGCNAGTGVCVGACQLGLSLCTNGAQGACQGAIGPVAEICNGKDDNCNGTIDEGVQNTCTNYATCATYQTCAGCPFKPTEVCNGKDDDCNGTIDDIASVSCGSAVGECKKGMTACSGGKEICSGGVQPSGEICDGKDNDCNGVIDNNVPGMGVPCGSSVGECKPGTLQCVAGKVQCVGAVGPQPEICDGKDNNCNGTVDDGIVAAPCGSDVGECKAGTSVCQNGALICQGAVGPQLETCDGKDNDCNGVADDNPGDVGLSCGSAVGACVPGQTQCVNGAKICVGAVGSKPEVCDGLDNDCDGTVDNGVAGTGDACGSDVGECEKGTMACQSTASGWALVCTGAVGPQPEICDGKDNDCNGQVDEDYPEQGQSCGTNVGECKGGAWKCDAGKLLCEGGAGPTPEICDGKDNDCNGAIDDNVSGEGQPCGDNVGECKPGTTKCVGAQFICVGGTQPAQEICDSKDNDCDGAVDQNAACPGSSTCVEGQCAVPCGTGEFNCPGGSRCINGYCIPDACSKITCKDTERCTDGQCVDKCAGRTCKGTERCAPTTGQCVDDTCLTKGCPGTQVCVNYACVDNPCGGVECKSDQMCVAGKCQDTCVNVTCPSGKACVAGVCSDDPCAAFPCPENQVCNLVDGQPRCEADPCAVIRCPPGQVCREGGCKDDPCVTAKCPVYLQCEVTPSGQANCVPKPGAELPKTSKMLAAGGGGFGCAVGQDADRGSAGSLLLLAALALLGIVRRRRRS